MNFWCILFGHKWHIIKETWIVPINNGWETHKCHKKHRVNKFYRECSRCGKRKPLTKKQRKQLKNQKK